MSTETGLEVRPDGQAAHPRDPARGYTSRRMQGPAPDRRSQVVSPEQAGSRVDVLLARWLEVSRSEARKLLDSGQVGLDGRLLGRKDKGLALSAGSELTLLRFVPPAERRVAAPTGTAPRWLAAGAGWLALDKPAGMPVHPLQEAETETALGHVAVRHPEIQGIGEGGLRSGIVHRLDVDTSGVLLMATCQESWLRLRRGFVEQRIEKRYRAIVRGELTGERRLDLSVRVAQHKPALIRVLAPGQSHPDARPISMMVRPLEPLRGATLVEVVPKTGFLHQIRVALAHLGHPLLGDRVYGDRRDDAQAARHMLHASALRFEEVEAHCEPPVDFLEISARLQMK